MLVGHVELSTSQFKLVDFVLAYVFDYTQLNFHCVDKYNKFHQTNSVNKFYNRFQFVIENIIIFYRATRLIYVQS